MASKQIKCLELFLKAGADVNHGHFTVLALAAGNGFDEAVKLLIQAGADVNKGSEYGMTPLMEALEHCANDMFRDKHKKCVELLLKTGADVNIECEGDTALTIASRPGLSEAVDLLIRVGADVNKVPGYCFTPLMEASEKYNGNIHSNHYIACMELLINAGADVNITTSGGSALTTASGDVFDKSENAVQLLIRAGADVNKFCPEVNGTPLWAATTRGLSKKAELLLKAGADVNFQNSEGNRALILVSMGIALYDRNEVDYLACLKLLLRYGAEIDVRNRQSENALQHCVASHRGTKESDDICRLLFAAGERPDGICDEKIPDCLKFKDVQLELKHICREAIRKHLLELDPHTHLFGRVPRLGLPSLLIDYLLYDMSLDDDIDDNTSGH